MAIPGLVQMLWEEGLGAVRYVLWDATCWHRDYSSSRWRNRTTEEQKRIGWELTVRMEKILCMVLHEAHMQRVEKTMDTLFLRAGEVSQKLSGLHSRGDVRHATSGERCRSKQRSLVILTQELEKPRRF